jgi:predicted  nucleic acid-binding Zn-ribbon protein
VEAQEMKDTLSGFITHRELVATQKELHDDLSKEIETVNIKVDGMKDIMFPLAEGFKNLGESIKQTNLILVDFVKEQRLTNGLTGERINNQQVEIVGLQHKTDGIAEKKKSSAVIIVAVITGVPTVIVGLFNLAPLVFN